MRGACIATSLAFVAACSGDPFVASVAPVGAGGSGLDVGTAGANPTPAGAGGSAAASGGAASGAGGLGGTAAGTSAEASGGAGEGGEGGVDDQGGEGGASPNPVCPSRTGGDWALGFFPEVRERTAQESHPFFEIANLGETPTSLRRLRLRYYFTKESDAVETAVCYWVTGDRCADARMQFGDVARPRATASRYLEITFPSADDVLVLPGTFEVRVGFKAGASPMIQSNDYSFDAEARLPSSSMPFPYKRWTLTTLYLDGELVWGTEPCPGAVTFPE